MIIRRLMSFIVILTTSILCLCSPPPKSPCPIEGLLLGIQDLPGSNWFEAGSRSSQGAPLRIGIERIGTSFVNRGLFDGAIHEIYRMEDIQTAYNVFLEVEKEDFSTSKYLNEWSVPSTLSLVQLSANNIRTGCNIFKDSGSEECRLLAQYGPYLVRFSIRLHDLHYSDVNLLFEKIDEGMTECLLPK